MNESLLRTYEAGQLQQRRGVGRSVVASPVDATAIRKQTSNSFLESVAKNIIDFSEADSADVRLRLVNDELDFLQESDSDDNMTSTSSRDRLSEFQNIVISIQNRRLHQTTGENPHQSLDRITAAAAQQARLVHTGNSNEFSRIASQISADIVRTYAKLEKLTMLARRNTLFDDRPLEIQELTFVIKDDMSALNIQLTKLQDVVKDRTLLYSNNNGQRAAPPSEQQYQHSSNVVVALQSKLASMTSRFKSVLEVRTQKLKESRDRRNVFSDPQVTSLPPAMSRPLVQPVTNGINGVHVQDREMDDARHVGGHDDSSQHFNQTYSQQQHALIQRRSAETQYLTERADTMQNIESTIVELGGIFNQLATMVHEQEEVMIRIDSNVEDAAMNVEAGHSELLRYFQSVTSNRWLMVKVFVVLIALFTFFVVAMV